MLSRTRESKLIPPGKLNTSINGILLTSVFSSPQAILVLVPIYSESNELSDFDIEFINDSGRKLFFINNDLDYISSSLSNALVNSEISELCVEALRSGKNLEVSRVFNLIDDKSPIHLNIVPVKDKVIVYANKSKTNDSFSELDASFNTLLNAITYKMKMGVVVLNNDFRVDYMNPHAEGLFHLYNEDLIGKNFFSFTPMNRWVDVRSGFKTSLRLKQEIRIERYFPYLKRWMDVRMYPHQDSVAIFFEDITYKKKQQIYLTRLASVVGSSNDAITVTDLDGIIYEWNHGAENLYQYTKQEVIGKKISLVFPEDSEDEYARIFDTLRRGESIPSFETTRRQKSGSYIDVSMTISPVYDEKNELVGASAIIRPVTDIKKAMDLLSQSERRFKSAISLAPVPVIIFNTKYQILHVSKGFIEQSGYDVAQGDSIEELFFKLIPDKNYRKRIKKNIEKRIYHDESFSSIEAEIKSRHGDKRHWDLNVTVLDRFENGIMNLMVIGKDVTRRKQTENRYAGLAYTDSLTGLMNRTYFNEQLKKSIKKSKKTNNGFSVVFLDIDNFKVINDTLGHRVGDALLVEVGERLKECIGESDIIARQGGDEFTFILSETDIKEVSVLQSILETMRKPFIWKNRTINFSGSIGVSRYPCDARDEEHLLIHADKAMYVAKHQGGNQIIYFRNSEVLNSKKEYIENGLKNDCRMTYQLAFDNENNPSYLEGLLAHIHDHISTGGDIVMENAKAFNFLGSMTEWSVQQVCKEISKLPEEYKVSLNFSHPQINNDLFKILNKYTKQYKISRSRIICEIPAFDEVFRDEHTVNVLTNLSRAGYLIVLDRFGEKTSSLSILCRVPLYQVKISKNLLVGINDSLHSQQVLKNIIKMIHSIGIKVTGVGIESRESADLMRTLGCDFLQGYFLHKPESINDIALSV